MQEHTTSEYERDLYIVPRFVIKVYRSSKSGVYAITNLINHKVYIGSSINTDVRIKDHKSQLKRNIHTNKRLQSDWNEFGEQNFKFEILIFCQKTQLLHFEQMMMDSYQCYVYDFGYNFCQIAGLCWGYKHSEESKQLMRDKGGWNKGIPRTPEEKLKISQARKGKPAWNKGIKMAPEVGQKISIANSKRIWTKESKAKLSLSSRGRITTSLTRAKLSAALKGHLISQETKNKISNSLKAYYGIRI